MPIFRRNDDPPRARTPEDRERARAERAARRAARAGEPLPPEAFMGADAPPPAQDGAVPDPPAADDVAWVDPPAPDGAAPEPPEEDVACVDPPAPEEPHSGAEPHAGDGHSAEPWGHGPPAADAAPAETPLQPTAAFDTLDADEIFPEVPSAADGDRARFRREDQPSQQVDAAGAQDAPLAEPADPGAVEEPAFDELDGMEAPRVSRVAREQEPASAGARRGPVARSSGAPLPPALARRARPDGGTRFHHDEEDPPMPLRRPAAGARRTLPPPPPPPGQAPAHIKRRRRRLRALGLLALLAVAALAWGANTLFQPFHGDGGERVTLRIPTNSTAADVGDLLAEKGVVDSGFLFMVRTRLSGADLQAGSYTLRKDSSYSDAIDALTEGPGAAAVVSVAIPEGRSRRETTPLVEEAGLQGSYLGASERPTAGFHPRRYGAPKRLASLEGFLFPATYELKPGSSSRRLVALQLDAFRENIEKVDMRRARRRNLTTYDVLTIASMVEREATLPKERPIIAAVIHNRLRQGMPLGIDATIRFATRNWTRPLRQSELRIDSPYNTRRRTGLPPGPIGSPGLDSIEAAANPAKVDYLYYVVKPNGDGAHSFSSTDEQFQRDVDAYNRERERRGGQSPSSSG